MPDLPHLASFLVTAFVVVIVPGITVSSVVSTALAQGMAAGFRTEAGVQLGRFTMILAVALALETVTRLVGAAFDIIKYAGAAYLVWLGVGYLRGRSKLTTDRPVGAGSALRQVAIGFTVLWSNPKALIFFGAFLPQFVDPRYPAWPQVIVLGLIEMAAGLVADGAYVILAAKARDALGDGRLVLVNRIAGLVLIAAALWLALQQHTA